MKMQFEVTYSDGRKVMAVAKPKDFVAFERQFGKSIAEWRTGATMESLYYLAWSPLHRSGLEPKDFDGFLDGIDDVELADDEEPDTSVDPFPQAPTDEGSAP